MRQMVSHGERAREFNLWISKLRNYKTKHVQHVDRSSGYTLHSPEFGEKNGKGVSGDGSVTPKVCTTDLQQCVQLLTHLLDTDGSLMGGPTTKKLAVKSATKQRKKTVHVVPRSKSVCRTICKGVGNKCGIGKSTQPGKAVKSGARGTTLSAACRDYQWVNGETAIQRITRQEETTHRGSVHIPTATDIPTELSGATCLRQDVADDISGPVPYNARLSSSTPNNTLLKDLDPVRLPAEPSHVTTSSAPKDPGTRNIMSMMKKSTVAKSSEYQCVHSKQNAPGLPLVFLNMDYNLMPGQSNPLNASNQVNIIKPPEPPVIPKLVLGKVEFKPNPSAWFQGSKPNTVSTECNPVSNGYPRNTGQTAESNPVSNGHPRNTAQTAGPISPFRVDRSEVPSHDVYEGIHVQPDYHMDPALKENAVDFSLYTNPGDGASIILGHQGTEKSVNIPIAHQVKAQDPGNVFTDAAKTVPSHTPARGRVPTSIVEVPTGLSSKHSVNYTKSTTKQSTITTQREKSRFHEMKVKRTGSRDLNSTCPRCAKFDKKKHSLKNKENILTRTMKTQPKMDKTVHFVLNDAATQCSPEKPIQIPTETQDATPAAINYSQPQQSLRHVQTLQCLLAEMKSIVKSEQNPGLELLMKQIDQTAAMFVPGLGVIDWRTEMELALQPLRSENAQLRRRLRINNQQMKEKNHQLELVDKPDPSYQTVHLELQRHKLEQDYKEMLTNRDQLRTRLRALQAELDHLRGERAKLLEIMVNKDTDLQKSEHQWAADVARYRGDCERAQEEVNRMLRDKDNLQNQTQILRVSVDQRDKEITRLRNMVRSLQKSMTHLLGQLRNMTPPDGLLDLFVDDQGNDLLDENTLDGQSLLDSVPRTPDRRHDHDEPEHTGSSVPSSASRALPFSGPKVPSSDHKKPKLICKSPPSNPSITNLTSSPRHGNYMTGEPWINGHMDETDYIVAPGSSPLKRFHPQKNTEAHVKVLTPRTDSTFASSDSPTVKELLTPLKDRMQNQYKRLSKGGAEQAGEPSGGSTGTMEINTVHEEDTLTDLEVEPLEVDTTLLGSLDSTGSRDSNRCDAAPEIDDSEKNVTELKTSMEDASRYSMTDYFKKYPHDRRTEVTTPVVNDYIPEDTSPDPTSDVTPGGSYGFGGDNDDNSDGLINDDTYRDDDMTTPHRSTSSDLASSSRNRSSTGQASFQDSMYKGTELDTSISTIDDGASLSSAVTVSSVGTLDDSAFKQGLADLDANIAKIQEQLQLNLAKYSS